MRDPSTIGAQIRQVRTERGWSIKDLAREAGVAENTVSGIERGKPSQPGKRLRVMEVLGLESAAGEPVHYPADVELVRDMVGAWLMDIERGRRGDETLALFRYLAEWRLR